IHRPVMTTLIMSGILLFGIVAYRALPVSDLPNVDFPTIQVQAQLPGGSPETMAASVATPLERQFSTIAGVDSMTSTSTLGATAAALGQIDPDAMAPRGMGIDEMQHAIEHGNVNLPMGTLFGNHHSFSVQATDQLFGAAAYETLIVAYRNGAPVRLRELGRLI